MTQQDDETMTTAEVAARFHVAPETLHAWAKRGYGPPSVKVSGKRLYKRHDVMGFRQVQPRLPVPKRPACDVCGRSD